MSESGDGGNLSQEEVMSMGSWFRIQPEPYLSGLADRSAWFKGEEEVEEKEDNEKNLVSSGVESEEDLLTELDNDGPMKIKEPVVSQTKRRRVVILDSDDEK